ncbi:hypothetical protein AB0L35_08180 [Streptomyces sp. NPDC052309]|uniref:Secreted protein n=1 Tax=Streptomyces griseicoloratus TaxID=2752516 RepID=A0A926L6S7_9ACTN|nr:hypothetical protein [Streptomyces griseicoloratus]MBD0421128.1 hypothetical protein [Streptomyces griseicoloratus]
MKRIVRALGAGVAGLALVGAVQGTAQAAGTDTAASVPSCVVAKPYYLVTITVQITNNCSTTQQVSVEYSKGGVPSVPDKCHTVAPGQTVSTSEPFWIADRYVGLIPC